jgi:hypothetical protein
MSNILGTKLLFPEQSLLIVFHFFRGKLWQAYWRLERFRIISAGICILFGDLLAFFGPLLLNEMVRWAGSRNSPDYKPIVSWFGEYYGYALAGTMFLAIFLSNFLLQTHQHVRIFSLNKSPVISVFVR